jgi:hypothetical protein
MDRPMPAEACTEVGAEEPNTPARWFASVIGPLVMALAIVACLLLICLSPLLPYRQ